MAPPAEPPSKRLHQFRKLFVDYTKDPRKGSTATTPPAAKSPAPSTPKRLSGKRAPRSEEEKKEKKEEKKEEEEDRTKEIYEERTKEFKDDDGKVVADAKALAKEDDEEFENADENQVAKCSMKTIELQWKKDPAQPEEPEKAKTEEAKPETEGSKEKTEGSKEKTEDSKAKPGDPKAKPEDPKTKPEDPKTKPEDPKTDTKKEPTLVKVLKKSDEKIRTKKRSKKPKEGGPKKSGRKKMPSTTSSSGPSASSVSVPSVASTPTPAKAEEAHLAVEKGIRGGRSRSKKSKPKKRPEDATVEITEIDQSSPDFKRAIGLMEILKRNNLLENALFPAQNDALKIFFEGGMRNPDEKILALISKAMDFVLDAVFFRGEDMDCFIDADLKGFMVDRARSKPILLDVIISRPEFLPFSWGGRTVVLRAAAAVSPAKEVKKEDAAKK